MPSKEDIIIQLLNLFSQAWIISPRKKLILESLVLFKGTNLSYIDCWIYCVNKSLPASLETLDRRLKKIL